MTVSSATTTPTEFIRFAEELADASRALIRSRFRRNADVEMKPDNTPVTPTDLEVETLIRRISTERGVTRRAFSQEEILARLLDPMVNEGARILEEGIAARPGDIDVVWINGYNWPAWRGGPMFWADSVGLDVIVKRLQEQAAESGDKALEPAPLLRRLAAEGKGFSSLVSGG